MRSLLTLLLLASTVNRYAVGVRETGDATIWYPARVKGELMRMRDYVPRLEDADAILHARGVSDEAIVDLFDTLMLARRDAPAIDGSFPTLVIVSKGELAAEHAFLAEHLARHGYIVRFARNADGGTVITERVSAWDFATDKKRAAARVERIVMDRLASTAVHSTPTCHP